MQRPLQHKERLCTSIAQRRGRTRHWAHCRSKVYKASLLEGIAQVIWSFESFSSTGLCECWSNKEKHGALLHIVSVVPHTSALHEVGASQSRHPNLGTPKKGKLQFVIEPPGLEPDVILRGTGTVIPEYPTSYMIPTWFLHPTWFLLCNGFFQ